MTDTTPSTAVATLVALDGGRSPSQLSPADAAALATAPVSAPPGSAPPGSGSGPPAPPPDPSQPGKPLGKGRILLRSEVLRFLRHKHLLSQQDMANDCWRRNFILSIATIKRSEGGDAVRYRTAREFARYFNVPVELLLLDPPK
jgi:hypothetical protein